MNEIKLTLTLDETNAILSALGHMPYGQVFQLVSKIHQQANEAGMTAQAEPMPQAQTETEPQRELEPAMSEN